MKKYLVHNGNLICRPNNEYVYRTYTPPIPSDTKFIYLANAFNGTGIPNQVTTGTDMGTYQAIGTITKNGTGDNCYLTNSYSTANYLKIILSDDTLNLMKANTNTFTYYVRVICNSYSTGGIISWRSGASTGGNNYCYMIRSSNKILQMHFNSSVNTNLSLEIDTVYKIKISGNNYIITDLINGNSYTGSNSSTRGMSTYMTSFWAGSGNEVYLDRFYGIAGIARETTSEEDTLMKNILMNQRI